MPRPINSSSRAQLRQIMSLAAVTMLGLSALYLIVISPTLFAAVSDQSDNEWSRYADIGDAYGGISAILSGLALCGIATSLLLQRRQATNDRIATERQRHFDIVVLSLNDPDLLRVIEPEHADLPNIREEVYINLMVGYWMSAWQVGGIEENEIRRNVERVFDGPIGRGWWLRVRHNWAATASRSKWRFTAIVDEEWNKARAKWPTGPATSE